MKNFDSKSTKKKIVHAVAALLALSALWHGHWIFACLVAWVAYIPREQPSETQSVSYQPAEISDDDDDDDYYKPTPAAFYQTSSSGSAIWTDYDEYIQDI